MSAGSPLPVESCTCPYDLDGFHDEAFQPSGEPRPEYAGLLAALAKADLRELAASLAADLDAAGVTFGSGEDAEPWLCDLVPRIFTGAEWELLERGLAQRVQALDAFAADVYAEGRCVDAGVVPARAIESCPYFEPSMAGVPVATYAPVAGIDVVRRGDGRLRVLEDNVRTPSGLAYIDEARTAVDKVLPVAPPKERRPLPGAIEALGEALRAAAPDGVDEPTIAVLSDGESNSAWFEHRAVAERLGLPLVTPADLTTRSGRLYAGRREVHVVYRRTDEDALRDESGNPTWLADLLLEPCRAGRLSVVNAFGAGVADDKLICAYVEDMIRFYLGEEPMLESVRTYDLCDEATRDEVLARADEVVVKPRSGHGGHGVFVGPHAEKQERVDIAREVAENPHEWIAQETIALSRHPTVENGELVPRHVDLRAFVVGGRATVTGITRFAGETGSLVVNSSQGGGAKDTWVVG